MSKLAFDYSKWDRLELSDDEETHHPNLDRNLNIRVNRVTRDRKEEEIDTKKKELSEKGQLTPEAEEKLESKRPLHMDNMCTVVEERTIIQRSNGTMDRIKKGEEKFEIDDYSTFIETHKALLDKFTNADWEESHDMLDKHGGILLDQNANTYYMLKTLDAEMAGNKALVKKLGCQGQIISQIFQLAAPMRRHPRDLVHRFFDKFEDGGARHAFQEGVDHFLAKIADRAVEKKKEQEEEARKEAEEQEIREKGEAVPLIEAMYDMSPEDRKGPGGLDPVEVFESLPEALQNCFKSGDVEMLKAYAASMDQEVFQAQFQRCIDSGLWQTGG
jgi:cell division cycle protein 37